MTEPREIPAASTMRRAAQHMREHHGPEHPRHEMWDAMAALLDRSAESADVIAHRGLDVSKFPSVEHAHTVAVAYLGAIT